MSLLISVPLPTPLGPTITSALGMVALPLPPSSSGSWGRETVGVSGRSSASAGSR
jgi:hypothetical protein